MPTPFVSRAPSCRANVCHVYELGENGHTTAIALASVKNYLKTAGAGRLGGASCRTARSGFWPTALVDR
jgi:hypothetical protein